ncbi:hypothetical protein BDC45DRAFT_527197 [Circinella umbellata]|nr:hypothetical protein BDC45DRAFT_527197 [Circinella umbellata]
MCITWVIGTIFYLFNPLWIKFGFLLNLPSSERAGMIYIIMRVVCAEYCLFLLLNKYIHVCVCVQLDHVHHIFIYIKEQTNDMHNV